MDTSQGLLFYLILFNSIPTDRAHGTSSSGFPFKVCATASQTPIQMGFLTLHHYVQWYTSSFLFCFVVKNMVNSSFAQGCVYLSPNITKSRLKIVSQTHQHMMHASLCRECTARGFHHVKLVMHARQANFGRELEHVRQQTKASTDSPVTSWQWTGICHHHICAAQVSAKKHSIKSVRNTGWLCMWELGGGWLGAGGGLAGGWGGDWLGGGGGGGARWENSWWRERQAWGW